MSKEYERLLEGMRIYYETEKDDLRKRKFDFEEIEFVLFVTKGPMCLRGMILHDECELEGALRIYAIDIGFEMNVKKRNCFELAEQFRAVPILSYRAKAVGLQIDQSQCETVLAELKRLKSEFLEVSVPLITIKSIY